MPSGFLQHWFTKQGHMGGGQVNPASIAPCNCPLPLAGEYGMSGTMGQDNNSPKSRTPAQARKDRLAEQLRANLQRRKQQVRARRAGAMDDTSGLPAADRQPDQHNPE